MSVETVCTFEQAQDILPSRQESLHTLLRAALDFLGRDWHGIQAVHIQILYTEAKSNQVDFVSGSCGSPLMVAHPAALFALLQDALKAEAKKAEANEANVLGFDECRIIPDIKKPM